MRGTEGTKEIGDRVNTAGGVPLEDSREQGRGVREQGTGIGSGIKLRTGH
jgi:hypothetical protein